MTLMGWFGEAEAERETARARLKAGAKVIAESVERLLLRLAEEDPDGGLALGLEITAAMRRAGVNEIVVSRRAVAAAVRAHDLPALADAPEPTGVDWLLADHDRLAGGLNECRRRRQRHVVAETGWRHDFIAWCDEVCELAGEPREALRPGTFWRWRRGDSAGIAPSRSIVVAALQLAGVEHAQELFMGRRPRS